jgi:hypothetical protein
MSTSDRLLNACCTESPIDIFAHAARVTATVAMARLMRGSEPGRSTTLLAAREGERSDGVRALPLGEAPAPVAGASAGLEIGA